MYPSTTPAALASTLERQRPAYEARLLFYHGSDKRRLEIARGFHASVSHVAGQSVSSQPGTLDWLIRPSGLIEFSGAFFAGTDDWDSADYDRASPFCHPVQPFVTSGKNGLSV